MISPLRAISVNRTISGHRIIPAPLAIAFQRAVRFARTGALLHLVSGICLAGFFFVENELVGFTAMAAFCFAQLDARSRYQDYKRIKDLLYENGFQPKLVALFSASRCQRDAVRAAASDLGLTREVDTYFKQRGYSWRHVVPERLKKNPKLVMAPKFWERTLFTPFYRAKYFLW